MLTHVSLPITLITGSEEVLVRQALDQARGEARERDGADPDRRTVSAADEAAVPALAEALGPTLFDEPALIIVTEADQIDDALWRIIDSAIAEPPPGVSLVVVHPGGVKGKKYLTALRGAGAQEVSCAALKKGRQTEDFLAADVIDLRDTGHGNHWPLVCGHAYSPPFPDVATPSARLLAYRMPGMLAVVVSG